MKIEHLNATFQPAKIGHPHGLQVTYLKDNSTRNIFVYHEDGKVGARLGGGSWTTPAVSGEPSGPPGRQARGQGPARPPCHGCSGEPVGPSGREPRGLVKR